jgi:hyperosmotically inducible periplasmic protein
MKRSLCISFLALALPVSLMLAQDKAHPSDDRITDQVRMRLVGDQDVKGGGLDVSVKDGVVTLHGRVDTEKGKKKAAKLAKKVKGVKSVDNELTVGPPTAQ